LTLLFLLRKLRWSGRDRCLRNLLLLIRCLRDSHISSVLRSSGLGSLDILSRSSLNLGLLGDLLLRSFLGFILSIFDSLLGSSCSLFIRDITSDLGFHVRFVVASGFSLTKRVILLALLPLLSLLGLSWSFDLGEVCNLSFCCGGRFLLLLFLHSFFLGKTKKKSVNVDYILQESPLLGELDKLQILRFLLGQF